MNKKLEILNLFNKNPERYWKVKIFDELNFKRQKCKNCGKFFWSIIKKDFCNDGACINYKFLDFENITKKRFSYEECWLKIKEFFESKNHKILNCYPVVCRWFPLNFTIAGIVNFYRLTNGKLDFEFPENPSVVNQICLRFNDIENVGLNGRSYVCFGMINQQSLFYNSEGYWKDECIELDLEMLTKVFGIELEKIDFIEDVWVGPAAFGPCLEYHILGLELGNAVFTEFEGTIENFKEMEKKVIDMGAGWERFAWISTLKPSSYDAVFENQLNFFIKNFNLEYDENLLKNYFKFSAKINIEDITYLHEEIKNILKLSNISLENYERIIKPLQNVYIILDHSRALLFALSDGAVLNNVGGGYNLRVIFRRIKDIAEKFKWNFSLEEIFNLHFKQLKHLFPNLYKNKESVNKILEIEEKKYLESKKRAIEIINKLKKSNKKLSEDEVIKLYDSEGINPEILLENSLIEKIPEKFYIKVSKLNEKIKEQEKEEFKLELPPTKILYYDKIFEFEARVLKVIDNILILDQTAFYPRGGGQEPDKGFINSFEVIDVEKRNGIVLHKLKECNLKEGEKVFCKVDVNRRIRISKNHTATHIINYVCKKVLGEHAWQHSAFKDIDKARLDIVHYENLSEALIEKIEEEANKIVESDLPIKIEVLPRIEAEKKYGFTIYQGGAIDEKFLRIVHVGKDIEACSGTHNMHSSTKEIGYIRIFRVKKIQDGVVRLEFVAGEACEEYLRNKEKILKECCNILKCSENNLAKEIEEMFNNWKKLGKLLKSI